MAAYFIYQFQLLKQLELYELQMVWLVTVQENKNLQIVRQQIREIRYQLDCITDTGHVMPPNFPLKPKM